MKQIYPDLWRTAPEHPLPDELPDPMMHAYVLARDQGNLLFCRSEHGKTYLLAGDTIFPSRGSWEALVRILSQPDWHAAPDQAARSLS